MSLINIESLFPDEPSQSSSLPKADTSHQEVPHSVDMELVKRNMITTNALYNLLLQKGIIDRQEYHEMSENVHKRLFPEDFR